MDHSGIVELWTKAEVASKLGKWTKAKSMWKRLLYIYSQSNCEAFIPMIKECRRQIRRCDRYMEQCSEMSSNEKKSIDSAPQTRNAERHHEANVETHREANAESHHDASVSSNTVNSIMEQFDNLANTNEIIQRSISPPLLQESFFIVQHSGMQNSLYPQYYSNQDLANKLSETNAKLERLKELSQSSFSKVKRALEELSPSTAHLFPDKLISNYTLLKMENKELKRKVINSKQPLRVIAKQDAVV